MFSLEKDGFTKLNNVSNEFLNELRNILRKDCDHTVDLPCGRIEKIFAQSIEPTIEMKQILQDRNLYETLTYISILTAYPVKRQLRPRHQNWHIDKEKNDLTCLCFTIYNTDITYIDGPTEFKSKESNKEHYFIGPEGTCLAFTTDTLHRGLENVSNKNREIFILSFNPPGAPAPYSLKKNEKQ